MRGAHLAGAQLAAVAGSAPALPDNVASLLESQTTGLGEDAGSELPRLADLISALGLPVDRTSEAARKNGSARLPMRLVSTSASVSVSPLERALWKGYTELSVHEVLSQELIGALADCIRRLLGEVVLHGLSGRADLNGQRAEVIGPLNTAGRVPVRVRATGECVKARPRNVFENEDDNDQLPCVLEAGAGRGALAHFLGRALDGWARVIACDDESASEGRRRKRVPAAAAMEEAAAEGRRVVHMSCEDALSVTRPQVVLASWHSSGDDWTCHIRACDSVFAYILMGEADSSTCGDGWATWGVLPPNAEEEYGLDEDTPSPHVADGFHRADCEHVAARQLCRFDSRAVRGFSTTVVFARDATLAAAAVSPAVLAPSLDEESLEASWERMQRSVAAGHAQRLPVEMDMQVKTDDT